MDLKTFIVSRTDKIGDFVVSIPTFATLKAMYPDSKIIALVSKRNKILATNLNCIDDYICVDDYRSHSQLVAAIRAFKPQVFIALYSNMQVARLAFRSGAKIRIGPYSKFSSFIFYNQGLRQRRSLSTKSEAEYNLDLIRKLDPKLFDKVGIHFEQVKIPDHEEVLLNKWLDRAGLQRKPFIVINPFTGGSNVFMSAQDYARLICQILEKSYIRQLANQEYYIPNQDHDGTQHVAPDLAEIELTPENLEKAKEFQKLLENKLQDPYLQPSEREPLYQHMVPDVVLLGIPSQQKEIEQLCSYIEPRFEKHVHMFINHDNLLVAASLIKKCRLFIGPSTGTTHLAGNYKKKAIVFYTNRRSQCHTRWNLFGDEHEIPFTIDANLASADNNKEIKRFPDSLFNVVLISAVDSIYQS